jgi:hypothetical protein
MSPVARRRLYETVFPSATGFWGHTLHMGAGHDGKAQVVAWDWRVRTITCNVFIPAAFAIARQHREKRLLRKGYRVSLSQLPEVALESGHGHQQEARKAVKDKAT